MLVGSIDDINTPMHLEKLDLNLLVVIDALLRTESVTTAATELNLTQSAVSSALNRARAHFQDELFFYDGQKMISSSRRSSGYKKALAMRSCLRTGFNALCAKITPWCKRV